MSDVLVWVECPHCHGDEGWIVGDDDYWEDCPWCGGQGGLPDLTAEERDQQQAAYEAWLRAQDG